ncbi:MAG: hypothetical protein PHI05_03705 [Bacilli bacterium]|nr:hypothetical protein [Bacilli bacterium]
MILRKPYAFFIKQFKMIHFVLALLISFLVYRTTLIIGFFSEYLSSSLVSVDPTAVDRLFGSEVYAAIFAIIAASILLLWVLVVKKKPFLFYIANIAIIVAVLIIFNFASSVISDLIYHTVHLRTIRLARDLLLISIVGQLFSLIKVFIYATGFDIKKFDFGQDLSDLQIDEEDNEEFEFEINVDTNKAHRQVRRRVRFSKYVYVENKFIINIGLLLLVAIIFFVVYFNQNIYNKVYKENNAFITSDFNIQINNSYITKKNHKNEDVSHYKMSFVVVEIQLMKHGVKNIKLDSARCQLIVNNKSYYHHFGVNELVPDLGFAYGNENIPGEFTRYLLIYEVPEKYLEDGVMQFKYLDTFGFEKGRWQPRFVHVDLSPRNLDKIVKTNNYNLGDEVSFKDSILGDTTFKLNSVNIAKEYKLNYQFCAKKDECYDSVEYLKPDIYNQYDKAIMEINGIVNFDNNLAITPIVDTYEFIEKFGTISYKINNQLKEHKVPLKEVKPLKFRKTNNYYIEVLSEVEKATEVYLNFNIRDMKYIYRLK